MIDFIRENFGMWHDGVMGQIIVVLIVVMAAVIFAMICGLFYWALDSWFVSTDFGHARVVGRSHHEAYTQLIPIYNGKTTTMSPVFHPERWSLTLEDNSGRTDSIDVDVVQYNEIKTGAKFRIEYKTGRLSGGLYIKAWEKL